MRKLAGREATVDREAIRLARRRLNGTLAMTALFSGALGLPLMKLTFGIANAMAAVFGDDDEPWDAETEFRNFLADLLPASVARIVTEGAVEGLPAALGIPVPEIGDRTALSELWWRSPDRDMEGRDLYHHLLEQFVGPIPAIFGSAIDGSSLIGDGLATGNDAMVWRGVEKMLPKAARDLLKTGRYATQGVTTMRGDALIEDLGVLDTAYQALGFTPAQVSAQYDLNAATKGYERAVLDRRDVLMDAYAVAFQAADRDATRAVLAKIRDFNRAHPGIAIGASTLRRSLQSRQAFSARTVGGVAVNPRLRAEVAERVRFGEE